MNPFKAFQNLLQNSKAQSQSAEPDYDVLVYGGEPDGFAAAIASARMGNKVALVLPDNPSQLGGIWANLAYLDRQQTGQIDPNVHSTDTTFSASSALYGELMRRIGASDLQGEKIAADPAKVDAAFRELLRAEGIELITDASITKADVKNGTVTSLHTSQGVLRADNYIDATNHGALTQAIGIRRVPSFSRVGIPQNELAVGRSFTVTMTPKELIDFEKLFVDATKHGHEWALELIEKAAGGDPAKAKELRKTVEETKLMNPWAVDKHHALDVNGPALSIAIHGKAEVEYRGKDSPFLFDNANIAVLDGGQKLSFNALISEADFERTQRIASNNNKPDNQLDASTNTVQMAIEGLFGKDINFSPAQQAYVRTAGINDPDQVQNPMTEKQLLAGGVPYHEGGATFSYAIDTRGLPEIDASNGHTHVVANIGARHTRFKHINNLAALQGNTDGPASGYVRIVEGRIAASQSVVEAMHAAKQQGIPFNQVDLSTVREHIPDYQASTKGNSVYGVAHARATDQTSKQELDIAMTQVLDLKEQLSYYLKIGNVDKSTLIAAQITKAFEENPRLSGHMWSHSGYSQFGEPGGDAGPASPEQSLGYSIAIGGTTDVTRAVKEIQTQMHTQASITDAVQEVINTSGNASMTEVAYSGIGSPESQHTPNANKTLSAQPSLPS